MRIEEYGGSIRKLIPTISSIAPKTTVLGQAGETVFRMVDAYERDGNLFLEKGDPVNAIACLGYACGWLDGGIFLGLVTCAARPEMGSSMEHMEQRDPSRLREKTDRYYHLLKEGLSALESAPDEGSVLWKGADEMLVQAGIALVRGREECFKKNLLDALWWFSYGHGWLDAGVRTGLFRITGRRELFTV
jgi:hypothetical protein